MQDKYYSIYSPSSKSVLGSGVAVVDATQEPLQALKIVIDGLSTHSSNGVWMGPFENIPRIQGFTSYDLVFLDAAMRVMHHTELNPEDAFPVIAGLPASVLILPRGSLATTRIHVDEVLIFYAPDVPGSPPSPSVIASAAAAGNATARSLSETYKPIDESTMASQPARLPEPPREPKIKRFLRWIDPTLVSPPEMRISMRRPSPELVAYRWLNGEPRPYRIGDISSTGVYLLTEERWKAGERVRLSLQREGPLQDDPRHRVEIEAEMTRAGSEGVGLRFLLPLGMDLHLWETIHESGTNMSKPEYVVSEMRYAEALAFLRKIGSEGSNALAQLMDKELGVARVACAIDIILLAKEMLAENPKTAQMHAHPGIVLRILENGSWAEFDLVKRYWAGLLASAVSADGTDTSNLMHIDSFSLMRLMHFQILSEGCKRVEKGEDPACLPEELPKITGTSDMTPIYRAIALLGELGLLEKSMKSTYAFGEKIRIAPTQMGLQLMARCNGIRVALS